MDKRDAASLLDALLGVETALARLEALEPRLKAVDHMMKTFGSNAYRHRKGLLVTIAAMKQHLKYTPV